VEIAIPFAVLDETTPASCPPEVGDRWRVNFSRVQWRLDPIGDGYRKTVDPATGKAYSEDNWVWSPQRVIAMHEPEHWGIVEFRDEDATAAVVPTPLDAAAWHLRTASYELAAILEAAGEYPREFAPSPSSMGPPLDDVWQWSYASDGRRYTLELTDGAHAVRLTEDGRLERE
jgi:hypothetical protein